MHKNTVTGFVIGIILMLTVAIGYFYFSQDKNTTIPTHKESPIEQESKDTDILYNTVDSIDTSNWQTYTNQKYGIDVKYPKNWEIRSEEETPYSFHVQFGEKGKVYMIEGGEENAIIVSVSLKDNPKLTSTNELLRKWKEYYDISTENIVIDDDIEGVYYKGYSEGIMVANIPRKNYQFSISSSVMTTPGIEAQVRPVLQGIIQSVDFVGNDSDQASDPSDWRTYTNEEYGFEFKHPKECDVRRKYDDADIFVLSCSRFKDDLGNFIIFTPGKNVLSFDQFFMNEKDECEKWLQEYYPDGGGVENFITVGEVNGLKAILNKRSCGHHLGIPKEYWIFNNDGTTVVNFLGEIEIEDTVATDSIIDTINFIVLK